MTKAFNKQATSKQTTSKQASYKRPASDAKRKYTHGSTAATRRAHLQKCLEITWRCAQTHFL
jgi:hypothetical protein